MERQGVDGPVRIPSWDCQEPFCTWRGGLRVRGADRHDHCVALRGRTVVRDVAGGEGGGLQRHPDQSRSTWASNELWAASAMAPWKSGPAARRDRLDRRGSSRRSSIRSMSVNCHTTTSASSRGQARRGRVPVFGRTSTSLWPAAPCRLPDDRAADAEFRRQLVLVREWRSALHASAECAARARPRPGREAPAEALRARSHRHMVGANASTASMAEASPRHPIAVRCPSGGAYLLPAVGTRKATGSVARHPTFGPPTIAGDAARRARVDAVTARTDAGGRRGSRSPPG